MTNISRAVHCAIYTRVSTDSGARAGLQLARRPVRRRHKPTSAARPMPAGRRSRGKIRRRRLLGRQSTDRPALQRLLDDIKSGRINVIVVYKVDRLTRSLADFAKLVELFDEYGVSFVSVTQHFNTTTSMGRLTLDVLLSFAQFEREVTSERIRDKIAASKRKGLWVGGMVPLGYELKDGKLFIVENEADQVRTIFRRYLELGSVNRLVVDLKERMFRTKIRKLSTGGTRGGVAFTPRPSLLYVAQSLLRRGGSIQERDLSRAPAPATGPYDLFEAVQARLTAQWSHRTVTRETQVTGHSLTWIAIRRGRPPHGARPTPPRTGSAIGTTCRNHHLRGGAPGPGRKPFSSACSALPTSKPRLSRLWRRM